MTDSLMSSVSKNPWRRRESENLQEPHESPSGCPNSPKRHSKQQRWLSFWGQKGAGSAGERGAVQSSRRARLHSSARSQRRLSQNVRGGRISVRPVREGTQAFSVWAARRMAGHLSSRAAADEAGAAPAPFFSSHLLGFHTAALIGCIPPAAQTRSSRRVARSTRGSGAASVRGGPPGGQEPTWRARRSCACHHSDTWTLLRSPLGAQRYI